MIMKSNVSALFRMLIIMLCLTMTIALGCGDSDTETATVSSEMDFDEALWRDPPIEYWPYVRWWWPGGAVKIEELTREMAMLRSVGFGGIEVQYYQFGFTPHEIENDPAIRTVGTPEFFEKTQIVAEEADRLSMVFDFTLGSGWSSGGPFVSAAPERQLLMSSMDVSGPSYYDGPIPIAEPAEYRNFVNNIIDALGPFDSNTELVALTAAQVVDIDSMPPILDSFQDITSFFENDKLVWEIPEGEWKIFAFYQNRTNHHPVGAAYYGLEDDALIMDHLDKGGIQEVIDGFAAPLLEACGEFTPNAVFVDSFELVGELPWTPSLAEMFREVKGYDLTPYLPLVFQQKGESKYTEILHQMVGEGSLAVYISDEIGNRVREDYEEVRAKMFFENFAIPLRNWADQNDLILRMQSQGGWGDYLDVYEIADIPESEALFAGGSYDFLKFASSAAHTAGRTYTGLETFVSMNNDPRSQTIDDLQLLAGRAFSAGITRIIYHGFPYQYLRESGQDWYSAPPVQGRDKEMLIMGPIPMTMWLDENHQVWDDLPEFNGYLSRLCYALTRGKNSADIAWLQPSWRVPDTVISNTGGYLPEQGASEVSLSLKSAGITYDRVGRNGLSNTEIAGDRFTVGVADYGALLLTDFDVASPELIAAIEEIADAGIPVIVLGALPERSPGFADYEQRDAATLEIVQRLESKVIFMENEQNAGMALQNAGVDPVIVASNGGEVVFALVYRQLPNGHVLFLNNESNEDKIQVLDINLDTSRVRVLNPETGDVISEVVANPDNLLSVEVTIPARRSVVLFAESK